MSLDGVMSNPEEWTPPHFSDDLSDDLALRLESCSAMVLGSQTYKEFAEFWPKQGKDVPFADLNNSIRKYVVSDSLKQADWNNSGVVQADDLVSLKSGGDLHITGSATLVKSLLELRLLDEIVILLFPVVLGKGKRMFDGIDVTKIDLVDTKAFPHGVTSLTYRSTE